MTLPEEVLGAALKLYEAGDALAAFDLLSSVDASAQSLEHRQLLAACALRGGAFGRAHELVRELQAEGHTDEESLGLIAREPKSRWQHGDASALPEARDAYLRGFRATGGMWTGINAATLTLVAGDQPGSQALAREVLGHWEALAPAQRMEYWAVATAADAALILGDKEAALSRYRHAVAIAPRAFGNLRAVCDNASAILAAQGLPADWLASVFPRPVVGVFSGHMLDAPGRAASRFPVDAEDEARVAIAAAIESHALDVGVAAAAQGADILFLEAMQAAGKETLVVLPCPVDEFRRTSVVATAHPSWGERFDRVIARADRTMIVAPHRGEDLGYQFHGAVMAGAALLRADATAGRTVALALWDGLPGGVGGTGAVVIEWAARGLPTHLLPLRGRPAKLLAQADALAQLQGRDLRRADGQRVVSLLFADVVGYSRLEERQVKAFWHECWGRVAALLQGAIARHLLYANTWGDAVYLVLDEAVAAADVALAIGAMFRSTDWAGAGLPPELDVRLALHAGPVYELLDPITGQKAFNGSHVSRAARIEPVTPAGQIYSSEAFAALLAFDDGTGQFSCEYVGTVPLAKGYGRLRTYRVQGAKLITGAQRSH